MTTVVVPQQLWVYRPSAALPQTTTTNYFQVVGGPVFAAVKGRVTTVLGASASVLKFVADPDLGADSDLSLAAGTSLTGFAVGRWVAVNQALSAFQTSTGTSEGEPAYSVAGAMGVSFGRPIAPGFIALNATGAQTGQMEWWCYWLPMVPGARVVAV